MTDFGTNVYFVGNWKSHKTLAEAQEFFDSFRLPSLPPQAHVIICPPLAYVYALKTNLTLGVQDISAYPLGAYTGGIAADMVAPVCKYAIVGHSERRKYFHETNEEVAKKVRNALDADITPILCLDEPYLESQLAFFETSELKRLIVAYEPLAAIGSGQPDTPEHANQIASKIIRLSGADVPVLYGGSVTTDTVADYVAQENVRGVLVGGASLDPTAWSQLIAKGVSRL